MLVVYYIKYSGKIQTMGSLDLKLAQGRKRPLEIYSTQSVACLGPRATQKYYIIYLCSHHNPICPSQCRSYNDGVTGDISKLSLSCL